ncbi:hypothetical protein H4Q26_014759 [Puccinia striiformis f. sp. tritici PST-130]|nr:hypothetical protein H4Q26_014759 [Puccinia striiformis f. sp. tritici PST-130]
MYSPRFLGGLMLAFSLVSISIASGHYALTCDGQKVGDEPARHWACVNSAGVYSEMKGVWDICVAKGELTACCIEGKDLCASNCKTLPTYPAPPFNKRNYGIHMVNFGCEKDEETVCCISLPKGQTPKDKDCAAISEK